MIVLIYYINAKCSILIYNVSLNIIDFLHNSKLIRCNQSSIDFCQTEGIIYSLTLSIDHKLIVIYTKPQFFKR